MGSWPKQHSVSIGQVIVFVPFLAAIIKFISQINPNQTNSWFYFFLFFFWKSRIIVDRIDENKDKFVDMSELKNWISFTQRRYIEDDVDRQWKQHNPNNTEQINWEVSSTVSSIFFACCKSGYLLSHQNFILLARTLKISIRWEKSSAECACQPRCLVATDYVELIKKNQPVEL